MLVLGNFISGLGTQAALVALPYQVYVQTHSALLTGLLGAAELGPLVAMALLGGALADRGDRRRLLALDQIGLVAVSAALCAAAIAGNPPIALLYVLAGLLAGFGALQNVVRSAIVPNLVADRADMPAALAVNFGLYQLTMVLGPGLGGLLIGAAGVAAAYGIDAVSCLAVVAAVLALSPQLPQTSGPQLSIASSIKEGLAFVRRSPALLGSFAIDLAAMTFGMPRALFPVLAVSVYGAGAGGTGLLFASVSAGAVIAALTTRWLDHVRRLGRVTIVAVCAWGAAIAAVGLVSSLWVAAGLLALAGAADSVSAVSRSVINQSVTPDELRGRMSAVFSLVVTSGPRLGDIESGVVASVASPRFSVLSGGVACVACAGLVVAAFPDLARYDKDEALAALG